MRVYKNILIISALCLYPLALGASIQIPDDIRNPFKIADPRGFNQADQQLTEEDPFTISQENAAQERRKSFFDLAQSLRSLPFHGMVSQLGKPNDCIVILGEYIFSRSIEVDSTPFDFNGSIYVLRVSEHKMVLSVTIDKETRELEISFPK